MLKLFVCSSIWHKLVSVLRSLSFAPVIVAVFGNHTGKNGGFPLSGLGTSCYQNLWVSFTTEGKMELVIDRWISAISAVTLEFYWT